MHAQPATYLAMDVQHDEHCNARCLQLLTTISAAAAVAGQTDAAYDITTYGTCLFSLYRNWRNAVTTIITS